MSKRVRISKYDNGDGYPWAYSVEYDPPRDDAMDYGSLPTWEEALDAALWALNHPERFDP